MIESVALLLSLVVPPFALFVVLEALSWGLPAALDRWRMRLSPSADGSVSWSRRAEPLVAEGVASLDGRTLHAAPYHPAMNSNPIRQAA